MKTIFTGLSLLAVMFLQAQVVSQPKPVTAQPVVNNIVTAKPAFLANATYVCGTEVSPTNINYKAVFGGTVFDEAKKFSVPTSCFVVPSDGVYHFDVRVSWLKFTAPGAITVNLNNDEFSPRTTSVQVASTTEPVFDTQYAGLIKL